MNFEEAILSILEREPDPQKWDSRAWSLRERELRQRAFFSAKVENARFLDRAQGAIFDFLAGTTEKVVGPDNVERTALRVGGRADFVRQMREFMVAEGMVPAEEAFAGINQDDITDIRSEERLRLIFDTNVRQAYGFGDYAQGMKPAVLRRYPAARLIRERGVAEPRPRHAANEGEVRLKTDKAWWADYINAEEIGGFGVPWGPYGFRSGMGQQDVSREEAQALGLDVDSVLPPKPPKLTDGVKASTKGMDPKLKAKLLGELRQGRGDAMENARQAGRAAAERARARRNQ